MDRRIWHRLALQFAIVTVLAAADDADRPAPVPDPIGLGERLALIDWLREQGIAPAPGTDLRDLRRRYWLAVEGPGRVAAATVRDRLEREDLAAQRQAFIDERWKASQRDLPSVEGPVGGKRDQRPATVETPIEEMIREVAVIVKGSAVTTSETAVERHVREVAEGHAAAASGRGARVRWVCDSNFSNSDPIRIVATSSAFIARSATAIRRAAGQNIVDPAEPHWICIYASAGYIAACPAVHEVAEERSVLPDLTAAYVLRLSRDERGPFDIRLIDRVGGYREWEVIISGE